MSHRNLTVDIAKGIGILLVVFGHNWIVKHEPGELLRVIFSFHVPLFFFMSGFFLKESGSLKQFMIRRADTLLKPYGIILLLISLAKVIHPSKNPAEHLSLFQYLLGILYGTGPTIAWVALWFLPHLFVSSILSMLVLRWTVDWVGRQVWIGGIATVFLAIGIPLMKLFWQIDTHALGAIDQVAPLTHQLPGLPFSLDVVLVSSAFMLFGFLFRKKVKSMTFNAPLFTIAATFFAILHWNMNETIDLNLRLYSHPVISSLQAMLGIYLVMTASAGLYRCKTIQRSLVYIGSGSLFILIFHTIIQEKIFLKFLSLTHRPTLSAMISFGAAIVGPLLLLELVKRQRLLAAFLLPHNSHWKVSSTKLEAHP
jgi:polysaccharide biosynthesis protein PslL